MHYNRYFYGGFLPFLQDATVKGVQKTRALFVQFVQVEKASLYMRTVRRNAMRTCKLSGME